MSFQIHTGLQLSSLIRTRRLEISLASVPTPEPGSDKCVRVEASPINPSDLGRLIGAADITPAKASGIIRDGDHREFRKPR